LASSIRIDSCTFDGRRLQWASVRLRVKVEPTAKGVGEARGEAPEATAKYIVAEL
jgi:hypothetical protein